MKLDAETREDLQRSLQRYAEQELEQPLSDLRATLLLDYILEEIGPSIYNAAIEDARAFLADKLEDLEATCFKPELPYWVERDRR